ncbi:hypothetical protein AVEN_140117-1 [Araneus ventricosus]|uniref:RNA-directed DNA polymerase n=1 Tax=Araneus ventricosus TaxID=182803 RepID=A0A4Y2LQX2_ARAVE|nr:hypothetical protein AVEN_140117-1 [Araneus ventricosus]
MNYLLKKFDSIFKPEGRPYPLCVTPHKYLRASTSFCTPVQNVTYEKGILKEGYRRPPRKEREALAAVWALDKFRGYIEGSKITVAYDHQPLKRLMKLKSPFGMVACLALQQQSFNLNLEYIPGKSNVIADRLSRLEFNQEIPSCEENAVSIEFPASSPMEILEEQLKDEDLRKTIIASEEAQLGVPSHEREKILKEHHDSPNAAHYDSDGTYQRIVKRYFWIGMRKFITNYVKNCLDCARFIASNQKPTGLLQTPVQAQRFETIAIDLFGPLPESKDKKKWIFIVEDVATRRRRS